MYVCIHAIHTYIHTYIHDTHTVHTYIQEIKQRYELIHRVPVYEENIELLQKMLMEMEKIEGGESSKLPNTYIHTYIHTHTHTQSFQRRIHT